MGEAVRFILNIGATMILARLLTPEDYGISGLLPGLAVAAISYCVLWFAVPVFKRKIIMNLQLVKTVFKK